MPGSTSGLELQPTQIRALFIGDGGDGEQKLAQALRADGIAGRLTRVRTWSELLAALRAEQSWDVLLSEHDVPGLRFMQVLGIVAEHACELPAVLVAGRIGEQAVADALQGGAAAYVSTEHLARLGPTVRRCLSDAQARRERSAAANQAASMSSWLIAAAPDAIVVVDGEGTIAVANARAETLFGYEQGELVGLSVEMLLPAPARSAHVEHRATFAADPQVRAMGVERDLIARARDDREFPVAITLSPVHAPGGPMVAAAIRDITPRMRAGEALRLAEERFRRAFEEAPIGMSLVALDGRCLGANRALQEIVGYREEELRALTFAQITHAEDLGADRESLRQIIAGKIRGYKLAKRYIHKGGRVIWVDLSVSLVRDAGGAPLHFIAQVQDVTAAREAQESLRAANARLQAVFDYAPAGMLLRARSGEILQQNSTATEHLAMRLDGIDGVPLQDDPDPSVVRRLTDVDPEMLRTGAPISVDLTVAQPDGTPGFLHVVRYPVLDERGEVNAFGSFAIDITDRKLAEQAREKALHEFEDAQRIAAIGSWFADPQAGILTWSAEMFRIFGRDPANGPASQAELLATYVLPEDRDRVLAAYDAMLEGNESFEFDYRIQARDGSGRTLHALAREDPDGPGCFVGTVQDVTEQRAAALQLRAAEERFRSAFENAPIGMAISDLEGNYLQVNNALCEIAGYTREQLCATSVWRIAHPDDVAADRELFNRLLADEIDQYSREQRYVRCTGEVVWVSLYATVLRDREGRPLQLLSQILDITERRMLETQLRHLADHDPLTGLLNRRGLESALKQHVARVSRYGDHGALLVLDLDHFKTVNDTLGHSAGDELIVAVAGLLARRLRASDMIARLGGDEFAILLPEADEAAAQQVAAKIVKDIRENTILLDGRKPGRVTASVGVTLFHQGSGGAEEALVNADLAMYDAKEAGRDQAQLYAADRHDQSKMKTRLEWIERIRTAIQEDRFVFHAQPIADLRTGVVCQYELLLRMREENGKIIVPGAFLHIAERYDLVQELDRWVTGKAIEILEQQAAIGRRLVLEVNLSGKSLGDSELLELIEHELQRSGVPPSSLIFEVTETAAVANIQTARQFADRLTELGCRFALDDFGAGFDSFYYLKYLPFDYLKIDGEFISNCTGNRTDQLVIESLVSVARGLGKQTIAEFVEDRETELFLSRQGVDLAQGYHIGRPVPLAEILNIVGAVEQAR
ncbi:MAG: PAS domain S-box protein [Solirubrobacteraceae bacterium]